MAISVKVPQLPESVTDAKVITWHVNVGDVVERDQNLVDLETDKVVLEVVAPASGVVVSIEQAVDSIVKPGEVLANIDEANAQQSARKTEAQTQPKTKTQQNTLPQESKSQKSKSQESEKPEPLAGPGARRAAAQHRVDLRQVSGTGKDGRITRDDVLQNISKQTAQSGRFEKRVPMSSLRLRIAERLVSSQKTMASLTTFNEVNLQQVVDLRARYKEVFEKKHGIRLGLMSFFVKAVIAALKLYPAVNASIDGSDIIYHDYFDIGIAVSTDRGLVVPIVRDAQQLSFAELEQTVVDYGLKARQGQLQLSDLTGGTFTITNGGVFGSLFSTPIINPPQSAILGMNNIVQRPIVENDQIVIRPMMYLALSYDHRIIDGKESVSFLRTVKQFLEDPARLLLDL
jgi:2-oxoglutarate dehydrogenase E2 component (dihydrolipoamide succinyltransferase)